MGVGRKVSGRQVRIAKYAPHSIDILYPGLRHEDALPVVYEITSEGYLGKVVGLKWKDETAWIYEADVVEAR